MLEGKGTSYDVLHSTQVYNKADPTDVYGATIVELWQDSVVGPVAGIAAASDEGMLGFNTAWAFSTQHASTYYPVSTTCYMQAFGAGNNYQYTYAKNGGTHNGAAFGGPGAQTTSGWFTGGYTNNPSGSGN